MFLCTMWAAVRLLVSGQKKRFNSGKSNRQEPLCSRVWRLVAPDSSSHLSAARFPASPIDYSLLVWDV